MNFDTVGTVISGAGNPSGVDCNSNLICEEGAALTAAADFQVVLQDATSLEEPTPEILVDEPETVDQAQDISVDEQVALLGMLVQLPYLTIQQSQRVTAENTSEMQAPNVTSGADSLVPSERMDAVLSPVAGSSNQSITEPTAGTPAAPVVSAPIDRPAGEPLPASTVQLEIQASDVSHQTQPAPQKIISHLPDTLEMITPLPNESEAPAEQNRTQVTPAAEDSTLDTPAGPESDSSPSRAVLYSVSIALTTEPASHAATINPPTHHSNSSSLERRVELSEVVRHVRTMITAQESRSTVQLEPAELGRMTLELVDAPDGLRARLSAEDPAVAQFLERNIQLLESEARLQGVGAMSFTVGADVTGGSGHSRPQSQDAGEPGLPNLKWTAPSQSRVRTRRELDTSA